MKNTFRNKKLIENTESLNFFIRFDLLLETNFISHLTLSETIASATHDSKYYSSRNLEMHEFDKFLNSNFSLALNRSKRQTKKKKLQYCDQCRIEYPDECPLHQPVVLLQIVDEPIMTRAQATLPSG